MDFFGSECFEDLMSRSDSTPTGRVHLIDLSVELQISEAELGSFSWSFLPEWAMDVETMTVTDQGAEMLRMWLGKES